jgi:putative peptidoglycan lipid II flippase
MGGGVYRSRHAEGDAPGLADAGTAAMAPHLADEAVVEPPGTQPEPLPGEQAAARWVTGTQPTVTAAPDADAAGGDEPSAAVNSVVMAVGSLVSRLTGFLRTAAVAAALGGGSVANAYFTAQFFPGMVYELLLGGILSSVLVPVLVRRRRSDPDGGEAYSQRLLTLAALALAVVTVLAVLAAPLLTLLAGTDAEDRALVTALSYLMLPIIFFTGMSALLGAVLNVRGHFAAPMWAPILNNLVVMAAAGLFVVLFGADGVRPDSMGFAQIVLIGGGTLLGIVVQTAGLWPALRRVRFRWRWRFGFADLGLRELGRLGAWMLCYVAVSQVGVVVLLFLLNRAAVGGRAAGVAIYNNVYLLMMMAHGIVAVSIITALLPRMSAAAADGRYADVAADVARGTRTATAVLAPVAAVYGVLALPIAVALFQRGNFTSLDAERTAPVLLVAGLALVPFSISQLYTFAYYAMTDTRTPALVNIPVVAVRIALQVGMFVAFSASFAASGMMIGNAVSYVVAAVVSAWLLRARCGLIGLRGITVTFAKVAVAATGAALAGFGVVRLLPGHADPGMWEAVLQVVVGGSVIGLSYLALALVLRVREIGDVLRLVRRRIGR